MAAYQRRGRDSSENDVNILLLGETGVGKTTFINAFANYLSYNSLDDALKGDLKVLIPSSFTVTDSETFDLIDIVIGTPDDNENFQDGKSLTQSCRSYIFPIGNRSIRLIDGPGFATARGPECDSRNFEHILSYINQYQYLNGICILLKPATTRLNIHFRYCIKELLRHLNVAVKNNIMFVFTHSRSTFYRPGEAVTELRALLRDFREKTDVDVPFNRENAFMFDNESFRFLAVYKQGLKFLMTARQDYSDSWNRSVEEFSRLIIRICQCDLHAVQETLSLNEAQLLVHKLSRPLAEIATLIQENILMAQQYKQKLLNSQTKDVVKKIPQKTGKFIPLQEGLTICLDEKCTEVITVDEEQRINYKSNCHAGCSCMMTQELINHPSIKQCQTFRKADSCRECGCDWTKHMHITYQYERHLIYIQLNNSDSAQTLESIIALIDKRISDLKEEETVIRQISVKFTQFLEANSITPLRASILEYLHHFIREEKQKQMKGKDNAEMIRGLEEMIKNFEEEISSLKQTIPSTTDDFDTSMSTEQVFMLVGVLYRLPINGKLIREQINEIKAAWMRAGAKNEIYVDLPKDSNYTKLFLALKEILDGKEKLNDYETL